jgi:hypothetical protein
MDGGRSACRTDRKLCKYSEFNHRCPSVLQVLRSSAKATFGMSALAAMSRWRSLIIRAVLGIMNAIVLGYT